MRPEIKLNGRYLGSLLELRRMDQQVRAGSLLPNVLRARQEAFILTDLPELLVPSEFREVLLQRLSLASSADPVSNKELTSYAREYFYRNDERFNKGEEDVRVEIADFNQEAPQMANLRIHQVRDRYGEEKGWFLASGRQIGLTDKEHEIMNLRAAGFSIKEVSEQVGFAIPTITSRLTELYRDLHVGGEVGVALLLVKEGLTDTRVLEGRVDLRRFRFLGPKQRDVLEALIGGYTETREHLAHCLRIPLSTVDGRMHSIHETLGTVGTINKAGLAVGYWLYQNQGFAEEAILQPSVLQQLTERQLELVNLLALGLEPSEIAFRFQGNYRAVEYSLEGVYKILGVKNELGAVLSLIKAGGLNLSELTRGFDLSVFDRLTPPQHRFMQTLVVRVDRSNETKALADHFGCTVPTIEYMISKIGKTLGLESAKKLRIRMAVLYLARQQQEEAKSTP